MPDFIPKQDTIYQDWLGNFLTVANANLTALGLIAGDVTPLQTDKTNFDAAITDLSNKLAASKAATQAKKTLRQSSESKARSLVKRIQAKVDVTNALKAQLQITVPGSAPAPPEFPFPPSDLVANVVGSGDYELTWKRNGNSSTTLFAIEARFAEEVEFIQIFVTTKTTYLHTGNAPGMKITYRVKGQRGEIQGPPSNHAVVNDTPVGP